MRPQIPMLLLLAILFACSGNSDSPTKESSKEPEKVLSKPVLTIRQQFSLETAYAMDSPFYDEPMKKRIAAGEERVRKVLLTPQLAQQALANTPEDVQAEIEKVGWTAKDLAEHTEVQKEGFDYFLIVNCDCSKEFGSYYIQHLIKAYTRTMTDSMNAVFAVEQERVIAPMKAIEDKIASQREMMKIGSATSKGHLDVQLAMVKTLEDWYSLVQKTYLLQVLENKISQDSRWYDFYRGKGDQLNADLLTRLAALWDLYNEKLNLHGTVPDDGDEIKIFNDHIRGYSKEIEGLSIHLRKGYQEEIEGKKTKLEQAKGQGQTPEALEEFYRVNQEAATLLEDVEKALTEIHLNGEKEDIDWINTMFHRPEFDSYEK